MPYFAPACQAFEVPHFFWTGTAVRGEGTPRVGVGACGCVRRIGASGFRRSRLSRGRMLRLAPRGFGNRQIAFAPGRRGVRAPSRRPLPCLPETGRTSTGLIALSRPARSSRSPAHACIGRQSPGLRLRGGCGAMLSSRAAPSSHPQRHAPDVRIRAPSRSSRTVRSTAPRLGAYPIARCLCGGGTPPEGRRKR